MRRYYDSLFKMQLTGDQASFVVKLQDKVDVPPPYYEHLIHNEIENCMREKENEKVM